MLSKQDDDGESGEEKKTKKKKKSGKKGRGKLLKKQGPVLPSRLTYLVDWPCLDLPHLGLSWLPGPSPCGRLITIK